MLWLCLLVLVLMFDRFVFQRLGVQGVLDASPDASVLNVGCHDDGARLRTTFLDNVLNIDIAIQEGYEYKADALFDARLPWPLRCDAAVLADMLEHQYDHEITAIFTNAREAGANRLVLTWPEDDFFWRDGLVGVSDSMGYRSHCNHITLRKMSKFLKHTGYEICTAVAGDQGLEHGGVVYRVPSRCVLACQAGFEFSLGVDPLGGSLS